MIEPPPELRRGPRWMREAYNHLRQFTLINRPLRSPNCEISQTPMGTQILPAFVPGGEDAPAIPPHPFQVLTRVDEDGDTFAGVVYFSRLFSSLVPNSGQTITGLLLDNPLPTDPGWFSIEDGDLIWLEVASGGATIEHGTSFAPSATAWNENAYLEDDGEDPPQQLAARKIIARVVEVSGVLTIQQEMRTHQVMLDLCVNGRPARYPFSK
jgi:hypothetical protein